ncbi:MAG TPA: transposase, partial [Anaerolineales bacterium]
YSYHSCRNRHCPKCQNENAQAWLEQQQAMLLPVPYFLLTFTLPAGLRELARRQPRLIYDLLLRMSADATQKLAQDPRFVGGQVGLVGVLHTWGRNLAYHPHVHYLVPAGGLAADGKTWLAACQKFLLPVKALSRIFRAKMRQALRKIDVDGLIPLEVWRQNWVVHCKAVGCGQLALKYLAPYIFRVAISNRRILKLEDERVTFRYQATDTGQERLCTLAAEEFIRRFLQHVLPKGFVKVRYYGFFSSGSRSRLAAIRQQLRQNLIQVDEAQPDQTRETAPLSEKVHLCPVCGRPMQPGGLILPAKGRAPP